MACGGIERPECISCPNRMRCHGKPTVITRETVERLVREAVLEVLAERGLLPGPQLTRPHTGR